MINELGHFALILALAVAAYQTMVPLYGAARRDGALMMSGAIAALIQLALIAAAFAALTRAYIVSDFSVLNVAENSHSAKPLIYKVSGVWGNHEGSMLLWVLIVALFGAAVAAFGNNLPATLKARILSVQGSIGLAFLIFIVVASNPFRRLVPPPMEGNGLNPILQDPALSRGGSTFILRNSFAPLGKRLTDRAVNSSISSLPLPPGARPSPSRNASLFKAMFKVFANAAAFRKAAQCCAC